jgi:hypothetical protein
MSASSSSSRQKTITKKQKKQSTLAPAPSPLGFVEGKLKGARSLLEQLVRPAKDSKPFPPSVDSTLEPAICYGPCGRLAVDFADLPKGTRVQNVIFAWAVSKIYVMVSREKEQRVINEEGESDHEEPEDLWTVYQAELTFRMPSVWHHRIVPKQEYLASNAGKSLYDDDEEEDVLDDEDIEPFDEDYEGEARVVVEPYDVKYFWRDDAELVHLSKLGKPLCFQFCQPKSLVHLGTPAKSTPHDALLKVDTDYTESSLFVSARGADVGAEGAMVVWWLPVQPRVLTWELIYQQPYAANGYKKWEHPNLQFTLEADPLRPQVKNGYSAEIQLLFVNPRPLCREQSDELAADYVRQDISLLYGTNGWKFYDDKTAEGPSSSEDSW